MLLSVSLILIVGMSMGVDMPKDKTAKFTWNVAYRYSSWPIRS